MGLRPMQSTQRLAARHPSGDLREPGRTNRACVSSMESVSHTLRAPVRYHVSPHGLGVVKHVVGLLGVFLEQRSSQVDSDSDSRPFPLPTSHPNSLTC